MLLRYLDTLLVTKRTDIAYIHTEFNSFSGNLIFTIDTFEKYVQRFSDIEICPTALGIYHKHTSTGKSPFCCGWQGIMDTLINHKS